MDLLGRLVPRQHHVGLQGGRDADRRHCDRACTRLCTRATFGKRLLRVLVKLGRCRGPLLSAAAGSVRVPRGVLPASANCGPIGHHARAASVFSTRGGAAKTLPTSVGPAPEAIGFRCERCAFSWGGPAAALARGGWWCSSTGLGRLPVLSAWRIELPVTVAGFLDRSRPAGERGGDWKRRLSRTK